MPRKRGPAIMGYDKALETFFKNVLAAVERHVDFAKVKCLVVAGRGWPNVAGHVIVCHFTQETRARNALHLGICRHCSPRHKMPLIREMRVQNALDAGACGHCSLRYIC
jgi:MoaA/NifB/PqqE/SkfB family radical SAM enzyme